MQLVNKTKPCKQAISKIASGQSTLLSLLTEPNYIESNLIYGKFLIVMLSELLCVCKHEICIYMNNSHASQSKYH